MGLLHKNSSSILEFQVEKVVRNSVDVLLVIIETETETIKYRIWTDERHKNLDTIEHDFKKGLKKVVEENKDIIIDEFLERCYIFVTFPDTDDRNQYSAKIEK